MPADDGYVCTCESRFVLRYIPLPDRHGTAKGVRILQQRWVKIGVERLDSTNSEWRDVPLVESE